MTKERPALQLSKKFSVFATSCARGATEAELYVLECEASALCWSTFLTEFLSCRVEAYNEVMAECDELSLLTSRAPLIALAQANDVRDTLECISEMKKQAKSLQEELDALLLDAEIRAQVAVLAAIPTRESLMQYVKYLLSRRRAPKVASGDEPTFSLLFLFFASFAF